MIEKRYNGWTNYETWVVNLWMSNDEGSYNYWNECADMAVSELSELDENAKGDLVEEKHHAIRNLEESIKSEIKDNHPLIEQASMYSDLMGAALSEVNWQEIAEHWVDDAIERVEG